MGFGRGMNGIGIGNWILVLPEVSLGTKTHPAEWLIANLVKSSLLLPPDLQAFNSKPWCFSLGSPVSVACIYPPLRSIGMVRNYCI